MKLSTESYKGVRDFYPQDQFVQNYIFSVMREVVESFGYLEYGASILEPAELYLEKSGEEIVSQQTYTFKDRGDRMVTLRPEMTPTVARMVANKQKELTFPLRWYSIPNLFRYEKPQKGRLREHFQLNVDMFGADSVYCDVEIIKLSSQIMSKFGAKDDDFVIFVNNRKILEKIYEKFSLNKDQSYKLAKLLDRKEKTEPKNFSSDLKEILKDKAEEDIALLESILSSKEKLIATLGEDDPSVVRLLSVLEKLYTFGVKNIEFKPSLVRGFDYYTEIVFEVFDTNKENPRSLFGGGRYDDLLDIFGKEKIPAFGFGMGDVTIKDFLETHSLLPSYLPKTKIYIAPMSSNFLDKSFEISEKLREKGISTSIDFTEKKIGDKMKYADKNSIPFVLILGENEIKEEKYTIKELSSGKESMVSLEEILALVEK